MQWVDMIGNNHWIMQHLPDLLPTSYIEAKGMIEDIVFAFVSHELEVNLIYCNGS